MHKIGSVDVPFIVANVNSRGWFIDRLVVTVNNNMTVLYFLLS